MFEKSVVHMVLLLSCLTSLSACQAHRKNKMEINGISFQEYDVDGDGFITKDNLKEYHEKHFSLIDMDKDGSVNKDEFDKIMVLSLVAAAKKENKSAEQFSEDIHEKTKFIDKAFLKLDKNKNESISYNEYMAINEKNTNAIFAHDLNGDMKVNKSEIETSINAKVIKALSDIRNKIEESPSKTTSKNSK